MLLASQYVAIWVSGTPGPSRVKQSPQAYWPSGAVAQPPVVSWEICAKKAANSRLFVVSLVEAVPKAGKAEAALQRTKE